MEFRSRGVVINIVELVGEVSGRAGEVVVVFGGGFVFVFMFYFFFGD